MAERSYEQYTIRRKVLKLFGARFHIFDQQGKVVGYCKRKSFKLKEDIRVFTDESMQTELLRITARSIIDFGATYDIVTPSGAALASLRRKGLKSTFVRDEWLVFDPKGTQIGVLQEDSGVLGFLRRFIDFVAVLAPQKFLFQRTDGAPIAQFRQHFHLFVYKLGIAINDKGLDLSPTKLCPKCGYDWLQQPRCPECGTERTKSQMDHLLILGMACLIASIEGRQG
jgi:hypothetical protein